MSARFARRGKRTKRPREQESRHGKKKLLVTRQLRSGKKKALTQSPLRTRPWKRRRLVTTTRRWSNFTTASIGGGPTWSPGGKRFEKIFFFFFPVTITEAAHIPSTDEVLMRDPSVVYEASAMRKNSRPTERKGLELYTRLAQKLKNKLLQNSSSLRSLS